MADQPLAVIDVVSNSGRVVVLRLHGAHIEILADARAPLRLAAELKGGKLRASAIERTVEAMRDFRAVAEGAGAVRIIAVATSAVRESSNADELVDAISRATGIDVEIIDGEDEARYSFLGAVHGLAIEHGTLVDIGGGSLEVTTFRSRKMTASYTLPLGALRLSERFFRDDPPSSSEVRAVRELAADGIREAGVRPLKSSEGLIGTGGTIRNLAKMDRRESNYPIPRVHGFVLHEKQIDLLTDLVASRTLAKRRRLRGLNADRADSIVAGALVLQTVMHELGAEELTVSGQGLREGIAYDRLGIAGETYELLGVPKPYVRLPVASGRNLALLVEIAARNHLMKLQGYDSAREFTRKIDEQIARQGTAASESLPPTNREEVASSELRSLHTRTRFHPDVLDRTRRQR